MRVGVCHIQDPTPGSTANIKRAIHLGGINMCWWKAPTQLLEELTGELQLSYQFPLLNP